MTRLALRLRPFLIAGGLFVAGALSCGREITGPNGGGPAASIYLDPHFKSIRLAGSGEVLSIGSVVDFTKVRVVLRRADDEIAVDTLVDFPANAPTVTLRLTVQLSSDATAAGELLSATMKYIDATGDTVFSGGPVDVIAKGGSGANSTPVSLDIGYVGPGADAASISISPPGYTGLINDATTFTAMVLDSSDAQLPTAPIAFTSTDSNRVRVNLKTGATTLLGARGSALIVAQTLTGQADTATVTITPVPTSLLLVSGGAQQVRQGDPFPQPIRVRANAVDGLGVAGVTVDFSVLQGQGSPSQPAVITDANGEAQVTWIAGDSAGAAILRASINGTAIGVNVGGTQLSSAATSLTFSAQPGNITAGASLTSLAVVVRDATSDTVSSFNGQVTLGLTGGTAGANLVGSSTVSALNGVALFSGLTVDRGGAAYRLVASLPALPGVPPSQTNTFNVAAAPPANVIVVGGAGQTAPASTILPDSVKVRVTDTFGYNIAGVNVTFAVTAGGGTISPMGVATDANGRAAARWTIGAAGAQQVTATVAGLSPASVLATIATGGASPVLFMGLDSVGVAIGRTRQVPIFLTNPTPTPLSVTLTMRDTVATWSAPSLIIPSNGNQALPFVNGLFAGSTWAIASSAAGTDSVQVFVDSATAFIDGFGYVDAVVGDTVRTLVMLQEPAGPGGVTLTVVSTDSAAVLVAPGSGKGVPEEICYLCADLRAAPLANEGKLLAPLAGTATLTIAQGQLSAQLVIYVLSQGLSDGEVPLQLSAPGLVGIGTTVELSDPDLQLYAYDTNLGVGQYGEIYVYRNSRRRQDEIVRLRSLDSEVATVDSLMFIPRDEYDSEYTRFRAVGVGTTQLVADYEDGQADTVTVAVLPGRLYPYSSGGNPVALGSLSQMEVALGYDAAGSFFYAGYLFAAKTVTVTSRDPAVVRPEFGQLLVPAEEYSAPIDLEATGIGSTWIVVTAPGYVTDSIEYTVSAVGVDIGSNTPRLAVGTVENSIFVTRTGNGGGSAALALTLTSTDPAVVRVLTPSMTIPASSTYSYGRIEGVSAGTSAIVVSGPGIAPDTFALQVYPPVLSLASYTFATTVEPDSAQRTVSGYITDGIYAYQPADTVRVKLRSTNPAALLVTDSVITFYPAASFTSGGVIRAVGPGSAQIVLDAPGYGPDTSAVITVRNPRLNFSATTFSLGRGLQGLVSVSRLTPNTTVLPFTLTVRGTTGVTVAFPADSFPIGTTSRAIVVRGATGLGTDTIIVNAPGMTPDTLYVNMANTRVNFGNATNNIATGEQFTSLSLRMLNISTFSSQQSRDTTRIRLVSRDTAVLDVAPDSVEILPGQNFSTPQGIVTGKAPGKTWIVATPIGLGAADSVQVTVRKPLLQLSDYGPVVMGMQEQSYAFTFYVVRYDGLQNGTWVRLTSSAPSVVSVPDSVYVEPNDYYAYFQLTSGDSTGSALVTAAADGFASSQMPVFVSRSHFNIYVDDDIAAGGRMLLEVYRENSNYYAYPSLVPIPLQFTVRDTTIARMTPDTATTLVLDDGDYFEWLYGLAPGRTTITVSDRRAGTFQQMLETTAEFEVLPAQIYGTTGPIFVTAGTRSGADFYLYSDALLDSTWVQLRSVGGRFATDVDSILVTDYYTASYRVIGITEGVDTLVLSSPNFAPDSVVVRISKGMLTPVNTSYTTIRQGDSVFVQLQFRTPDGAVAFVDPVPLTFTLSTTAAIQTTIGAGPVSTRQANANQNNISFWVKALAPGSGTVTVTNPAFVPFEMTFSTRSP